MSSTSPFFGRRGIVALVSLAVLAAPAFGRPINAFDFPQPSAATDTVTGNDAFFFTPVGNMRVTALGMYDHNQDGLTQVHTVGLYRVSGLVLLQSITVGPNDGFINGVFRFQNIPNTLLSAGTQYAVSGFTVAAHRQPRLEPAWPGHCAPDWIQRLRLQSRWHSVTSDRPP